MPSINQSFLIRATSTSNSAAVCSGASLRCVSAARDTADQSDSNRENIAYFSGGAIAVLGSAVASLLIEASTFDTNAVQLPEGAGGAEMTVRVNTGGFAIGAATGYSVPIWRIDDGPVFGIPWELCQLALQLSEEIVDNGFAPTWSSDLKCANYSYSGPDSLYSHVVTLSEGSHTLWTGLQSMVSAKLHMHLAAHIYHQRPHHPVAQTANTNAGWQQAWIEITGAIGPIYPTMKEE